MRSEGKRTCAALVLIVFLAAFLRLRGLGEASLWLDELYTIEHASKPALQIAGSLRESGAHPPLFFFLTHLALRLGDSEWIVRLPVAMIGIVTIPLLYALGKRIFGREVGLAAALLLAVSPFHVHFSREARMYPLLALLSLLSLYALWRALEENTRPWWAVFTVATVLNLYTHYFALLATAGTVLFAVVAVGYDWLAHRKRQAKQTVVRLVLCCSIVALAYLPWLSTMRINFFQRQADRAVQQQASSLAVGSALLRQALFEFGGGRGAATVIECAFVLGLVALMLRSRWKVLVLGLCWIMPPLIAIAVVGPRKFDARYVAYLQPLFLMLAAVGIVGLATGLARLGKPISVRPALYAATCVIGVVGLAVVSMSAIGQYEKWHKPDWKGVAAYLEGMANQGDIVIVDGSSYGRGADSGRPHRMLSWYLRHNGKGPVIWKEVSVANRIRAVAYQQRQVYAVLLIINPANWTGDPQRKVSEVRFQDTVVLRLKEPKVLAVEDVVEMLEAMTRGLKSTGPRFDIYLALAEVYKFTGDAEKAESYIEMALENVPASFTTSGQRGAAYRRLGLDQ